VVRNQMVLDLLAVAPNLPPRMKDLLRAGDEMMTRLRGYERSCTEKRYFHRLSEVRLLPPVLTPGRYLDFYSFEGHVKNARDKRGLEVAPEWYERPTYYNGNPYAMVGDGAEVDFPVGEEERDYEMELAVVIGRPLRNLGSQDWRPFVAGFTIVNDFSARQRQASYVKNGLGPSYAKDFATGLGPWIVTPDECPDPARIELVARVNGKEWSRGRFEGAHYDWGDMLALASENMDLRPGDVVASGTFTGGCGYEFGRFLEPGDQVEIEMLYEGKGLGTLHNRVAF
jgi:fumarylacetoacetate (FAA) hydrolase